MCAPLPCGRRLLVGWPLVYAGAVSTVLALALRCAGAIRRAVGISNRRPIYLCRVAAICRQCHQAHDWVVYIRMHLLTLPASIGCAQPFPYTYTRIAQWISGPAATPLHPCWVAGSSASFSSARAGSESEQQSIPKCLRL